jgi:hypothetical protein
MEQLMYDLAKASDFIDKVTSNAERVRGPNAFTGENRAERRKRERAERKQAKRAKTAA